MELDCECTECHWIVHSQMVNFRLYEFHLNKKNKQKQLEIQQGNEKKTSHSDYFSNMFQNLANQRDEE